MHRFPIAAEESNKLHGLTVSSPGSGDRKSDTGFCGAETKGAAELCSCRTLSGSIRPQPPEAAPVSWLRPLQQWQHSKLCFHHVFPSLCSLLHAPSSDSDPPASLL